MKSVRVRSTLLLSILLITLPCFISNVHANYQDLPPEVASLVNAAKNEGVISGNSAVILEKKVQIYSETNGECVIKKRIIGIVLDQKAASDYSQIEIPFNEHFEQVSLDFGRTYAKNRGALDFSKDAIQIKTPPYMSGAKTYTDMRSLTFSLPGLAPGTIFDYQMTKKSNPVIAGEWTKSVRFSEILTNEVLRQVPRIDAIFRSNITVYSPQEMSLRYALYNSDARPSIETINQRKVYSWSLGGLKTVVLEARMPSLDHIIPSIKLTSTQNWDKVHAWASSRFDSGIVQNQDIDQLARSITTEARDKKDKIEAVYKYVQSNIEYVMADFGRSGFKPHPADQVVRNGYGDCKDQTALMISLLGALGIRSYPALLIPFPYRNVDRKIPSHAFSHAIVYVPRPDGDLWLDTTSNSKFPNLFWANQHRTAFVLDGIQGRFMTTPEMNADHNRATIKTVYRFEDDDLYLNMNISAACAIGDSLKGSFSAMQPEHRDQAMRAWAKNMYPRGKVVSVDFSDIKNSELDFHLNLRLKFEKAINDETKEFPFAYGVANTMNFFSILAGMNSPEERRHDYVGGFNCQLNAEWSFSPPDASFAVDFLPEEESIKSDFFDYRMGYTRSDEVVNVISRLKLKHAVIPKAEYGLFYDDFQELLKTAVKQIIFKKQNIDQETVALEQEIAETPDNIAAKLNLSKRYLKTGKYTEAHQLLEKAVQLDRQNAELHYYYGIALGYVNRYDAANAAFQKAKDLGYLP